MASPRTDCEDREGSEHQGELGDVAERVLPGEAREDGHVSPTTALHEGLVEAPDAVPLHPVGALHPALVEAGHLQVDVRRPLPHVPDLDAGQLVRRAVQAARDVAAVTDTLAQLQTVSLERVTAGVHLGRDELQLLSLLHLGGGAGVGVAEVLDIIGRRLVDDRRSGRPQHHRQYQGEHCDRHADHREKTLQHVHHLSIVVPQPSVETSQLYYYKICFCQ